MKPAHLLPLCIGYNSSVHKPSSSLVAQTVENLPACGRCGFDPWVGKIPWRRVWQPTPLFLPRESHGQRSLVGNSLSGRKGSDTTEWLSTTRSTHHYISLSIFLNNLCSQVLYCSLDLFLLPLYRKLSFCGRELSHIFKLFS